MTGVTTALHSWLGRGICVCVCPVYEGFKLICKLSNGDARTEIKSSSQGLVPLSGGNGFCLKFSTSRRGAMGGWQGEENGGVKELGYADR